MTVHFPSARRASRDRLAKLLEGRADIPLGQAPTVSTKPLGGQEGAWQTPWLQVSSDGLGSDSRLAGRQTIRVTVWHTDEGLAEDLASLARSLLLGYRGADVHSFGDATDVVTTTDDAPGLFLASFTLTARVRPVNL